MKLYSYRYSPNPLKVRWALSELDLIHQVVEVNLLAEQNKTEEFRALNPSGEVPVLQQGDFVLTESNAILTYLGRYFGKQFWPRRPELEGEAFQWLHFESCNLAGPLGDLWFQEIVSPLIGRKPSLDVVERAARAVKPRLSVIERHLQNVNHFVEDEFSLVDCSLGTTLSLWRGTSVQDENVYPAITDYLVRLQHRKAWNEVNGNALYELMEMRLPHSGDVILPDLGA